MKIEFTYSQSIICSFESSNANSVTYSHELLD